MLHALNVAGNAFEDGPRHVVRAPWDGSEIGEVVLADAARVDLAIEHSVKAFAAMRRTSASVRKRALRFIAETIGSDAQSIAATLADESGKSIALARAEVVPSRRSSSPQKKRRVSVERCSTSTPRLRERAIAGSFDG